MTFWNVARVAAAIGDYDGGGAPQTDIELTGINTDSRSVTPGQLFLALVGENFDGHDYVETAIAQGAAAVVVADTFRDASFTVPVFRDRKSVV